MNHLALIAKTQSLIAAGDIVGAESALVELADAEGDGALMVVLEQLPPKDILAVMREYDDSKESVINLLVTPAQFARAVVLIGRDAPLLRQALADTGVALLDAPSMERAVDLANAQAHVGDAVLMSPACASFDMFRDYAHRAQVFCEAVAELALAQGTVLEARA